MPALELTVTHSWRLRQALPNWAQQTLQRHAGDVREIKTMDQLEQGTTGDAIWDAMQHQLNQTGEGRLLSCRCSRSAHCSHCLTGGTYTPFCPP